MVTIFLVFCALTIINGSSVVTNMFWHHKTILSSSRGQDLDLFQRKLLFWNYYELAEELHQRIDLDPLVLRDLIPYLFVDFKFVLLAVSSYYATCAKFVRVDIYRVRRVDNWILYMRFFRLLKKKIDGHNFRMLCPMYNFAYTLYSREYKNYPRYPRLNLCIKPTLGRKK